MLPLDYLHALCLVGIALYVWRREPPRLLLVPLMLISFFVLYGVGQHHLFRRRRYRSRRSRYAVTLSLILMWVGLVVGIEAARCLAPGADARVRLEQFVRWGTTMLTDTRSGDQLLAVVGVLVALFMLADVFRHGQALADPRLHIAAIGAREAEIPRRT